MQASHSNVVFTEAPEPIRTHDDTPEAMTITDFIDMNRKRVERDKQLISTSSDNMHHI